MHPSLAASFRVRRRARRLSQAEVARRSGTQQRQVSTFERGGDVTVSTLLKLSQALDLELLLVPREHAARVDAMIEAMVDDKREPAPSKPDGGAPPSLLDRYRVSDEDDPADG